MKNICMLFLILCIAVPTWAQRKKKKDQEEEKPSLPFSSSTLSGLKFRSIGPALTTGRISDFAVNPNNRAEYYVAVSSGGVWKTENAGTTYKPIFDNQSVYSIACITMDPQNPYTLWVGTGENNGQRSVAYGDGVYKSVDGGKSWKNMGLKSSEHIGNIVVHPHNSDIVYVAAQGPLWSEGGERGLYKTADGGENWERVLKTDEHTGVSEVLMDPRDPNVLYATTWQRRRHVYTWVSGGPGSAFHKSTDGGKTWRKIGGGLPGGDLGRIGIAISPANPDIVFAIVEAPDGKGGFFRSTNRGESWEKRNSYSSIGLYYQEIFCDPVDPDRIYFMDTFNMVSDDGGKTINRLGEKDKHVDNHALWIDPNDPNYYLAGCDGGVYESFDRGKNWRYHSNLPITQFYKVSTDNALPFYNVYGGTQDNNSLGGPSRTTESKGIVNSDWFVTNGGDGFETQVDPNDPNIVYAQAQYGYLVRYDRKSGERVFIQPQPGKDEPGLRWNWDAPLLISPHSPSRIYFSANRVFRSEDRGASWTAISPDLSRQLDRNTLPVMGKIQGLDAVAKHMSTSIFGNIVAFDESPLQEDLLFVGTDDGLIHISENGGQDWRKISNIPGVPDMTYVNFLKASQHDANVVYAVFNNHKNGDFKPYVYKSSDKGITWRSITNDLPEKGTSYAFAEDHVDPNLLFVGTEFSVFFSHNGGTNWTKLSAGLPTIAVRDMEIQKRENDLVLGTFGRSFYILDDYAPLRNLSKETFDKVAHIFPIKDALHFVPSRSLGSSQGSGYYAAPNPEVGAVFTYFLKEVPQTLKQARKKAERDAPSDYPSREDITAEDEEEKPYLLFTIEDADGNVIKRIRKNASKGVKRIVWDYSTFSAMPVSGSSGGRRFFGRSSPMAAPGDYFVSMAMSTDGTLENLTEKVPFKVVPLNNTSLGAQDRAALAAFQREVEALRGAVNTTSTQRNELNTKITAIRKALEQAPGSTFEMMNTARAIQKDLNELGRTLNGNRSLTRRQYETAPSISGRISFVVRSSYGSTSAPSGAQRNNYQYAKEALEGAQIQLDAIRKKVQDLEKDLEKIGAPYTPGRG